MPIINILWNTSVPSVQSGKHWPMETQKKARVIEKKVWFQTSIVKGTYFKKKKKEVG